VKPPPVVPNILPADFLDPTKLLSQQQRTQVNQLLKFKKQLPPKQLQINSNSNIPEGRRLPLQLNMSMQNLSPPRGQLNGH
jgi:hypothetical protein